MIAMRTGAPRTIKSIVHDQAFTYAAQPEFEKVPLGEAVLEEHQFLESHVRLRIVGKVSIVDVACLLAFIE